MSDKVYTNDTIHELLLPGYTLGKFNVKEAESTLNKIFPPVQPKQPNQPKQPEQPNPYGVCIESRTYQGDDAKFNKPLIYYEDNENVNNLNKCIEDYGTNFSNIAIFHGYTTSYEYQIGDKIGSYGYLSKTSDIIIASKFTMGYGSQKQVLICHYPNVSKHFLIAGWEKEFLSLPGENFVIKDIKTVKCKLTDTSSNYPLNYEGPIQFMLVEYIGQLPQHEKNNPLVAVYNKMTKDTDVIHIILKNGSVMLDYSYKNQILIFEPLYYNNLIKSILFNGEQIYQNSSIN